MTTKVLDNVRVASGGEGYSHGAEYAERQAAARRGRSLAAFVDAVEASSELQIPEPITEVKARFGTTPQLSAEAFELARQVYYLNHASIRDAARAVIAAGLAQTDDLEKVVGQLKAWWDRHRWPRRSTLATFAIRDANNDGGLYRSERLCRGLTTGTGPAPAGKSCGMSAMGDSDYCFGHDPRSEFVAARAEISKRLQAASRVDYVPIKPFADWCEKTRLKMLDDAKRGGEKVHFNTKGWGMLSDALQVDQSQLTRLVKGVTSRGEPVTTVSASLIVRWLDCMGGVSFEDIYGFAPPTKPATPERLICPQCDGPKNSASKICRECFDASGDACKYVNRRGEQCGTKTKHKSGYCCKCRQIVFRERVDERVSKPAFVSNPMLTLATGAYAETPRLVRIGQRMWEVNACGVSDVFSSQKTLTGSLRKQFRKRGWTTPEAIAAAHVELVAAHGEVPWPKEGEDVPLSTAALLPPEPYIAWLQARYDELGTYGELAQRLRVSADDLSRRLRGLDDSMVLRNAVDQALIYWGDGTRFEDIYGGGAE